jgi:mono/diheme cytochrome c family protein
MATNGTKRNAAIGAIALATLVLVTVSSARADDASEKLYATKCAACHGPDGKGQTAMGKTNKLRDFTSADVQKQSDDELTAIITNGKNKMPAYGKSLKPDQIKGLVAYIRTLDKKG